MTRRRPPSSLNPVSDEDRSILIKYVGEPVTRELIEFDENIQTRKWNLVKGKSIPFPIVDDRDIRRSIHQVGWIPRSENENLANQVHRKSVVSFLLALKPSRMLLV